jgi:hypothetical protein
MTAAVRKPCLQEQYAIAAQSSALVLDEHAERALDRLGAMGMAAASLAAGDQDARIPIASATLPQVLTRRPATLEQQLTARLAPAIWRLVTHHADLDTVAHTFAQWMTLRPRLADIACNPEHADRLVPFARRVLAEWLHDRCGRCGGSGRLQLTAHGPVRTLGSNARNARYIRCTLCFGHGGALMRPAEQAAALGLPLATFDAAGWPGHFRAARAWLARLRTRPTKHLRRELERL